MDSSRFQAEAMRVYARQARLGLDAQNHAAEIKLRAERRAGELLVEMDKNPGGRPAETGSAPLPVSAPTLVDVGITKSQSSRWQAVAAIPEPVFQAHARGTRARGDRLIFGQRKQV